MLRFTRAAALCGVSILLLAACGSKSSQSETTTATTAAVTTIDPASVVEDVSSELKSLDEDLAAIDAATSELTPATTTPGGS